MENTEYADALATNLRERLSSPWRDKDCVSITSVDGFGIIQFLHAHRRNIEDASRLDALDRMGSEWRILVNGKVMGKGPIRSAIDQALSIPR